MTKLFAIASLTALLFVSALGQKATKATYDRGIQNDSTGIPYVRWNSVTGDYIYNNCGAGNPLFILAGVGEAYTGADGSFVLEFRNGDFKGIISEHPVLHTGDGVLWFKKRTVEPVGFITDSNTENDNFVCPKH